jgi:hypothetical protein
MNNRRKLVFALGAGAVTAPFPSFAQQQAAKVVKIGWLETGVQVSRYAAADSYQRATPAGSCG